MPRVGAGLIASGGLATLALVLSPAFAASLQGQKARVQRPAPSFVGSGFTPAVADARLAAEFARRGIQAESFRFTPSAASPGKKKAVNVAVRATRLSPTQAAKVAVASNEAATAAITAITPTAYTLGASVGWKRFALSGDVARVQGGALPGSRDAAAVGVSYAGKKFTGRVEVGAERMDGVLPRLTGVDSTYSLDVGGSYRIGRNLDVTGGVRYKIQRDRLEPLEDDRRDSQAVYLGTAFRF